MNIDIFLYNMFGDCLKKLLISGCCIYISIDHFTVVCSVTWPLDGSEAGIDLVLIQTFLLLSC